MTAPSAGPGTAVQEAAVRTRAEVFRLAARLFVLEIDLPLFREMALLQRAQAGSAEPELDLLDEELLRLDEQQALTELAVEYCRLFIGPRPPCPPYAAIQAGAGVLGLAHEQAIDGLARRYGLSVHWPAEAPVHGRDHIGVMLALLAELTGLGHRADSDVQHFLRLYMLPWAPDYLVKVEREARLCPYRTVARAVRTVLGEAAEEHQRVEAPASG